MTDQIEALSSLHTALVDSRNGYEEALDDAEGKGLTPLFRDMISMRTRHADEVASCLRALGERVDDKGSFMSTVHRAVISVRAVITGLGTSILPGLIDGEERIRGYYDDAIKAATPTDIQYQGLLSQRSELDRKIQDMKLLEQRSSK